MHILNETIFLSGLLFYKDVVLHLHDSINQLSISESQ